MASAAPPTLQQRDDTAVLAEIRPEPAPEPAPSPSFWDVVRRHRWLLVACCVCTMAAAALVGLVRKPTYSAETRLNVGRIAVNYQSVPGFVEGAKSLAASYSRAVSAEAVTRPIAQQTRLSLAQIDRRVDASPIVDSPIFAIKATGPSPRDAIALANLSATSLVKYVVDLNRQNPDAGRLLFRFREASLKIRRLGREHNALRRQFGFSPPAPAQERLDQIQANVVTARLQQTNLRGLYERSQEGQAITDTVQVLSPATEATSDRLAKLQRLLVAGLLAGLVIGGVIIALRGRLSLPRVRRA